MNDLGKLVESAGGNSMDYADPAFPDRRLVLHSARPQDWDPGFPIVIVHHGVGRNGRSYRDYWLKLVDTARVLAVSVEFPEASFPEYLWYNFGNLHTKDGAPNPREQWTFGIDERLFAALRAQQVTTRVHYGLFGHSAGGQFVHRMLSFGYRDHVAVAVSANAGTYAMPDLGIDWPWGVGATGLDEPALRQLLAFPITVMAGTEDTVTNGKFFPGGPRSMRQGAHRYERAQNYVRLGHQAAAARGIDCAWRVIDVPGVGHDGRGMAAAAAPLIAHALHQNAD
jgi:predicted esterase